jgi:hypothetical protein
LNQLSIGGFSNEVLLKHSADEGPQGTWYSVLGICGWSLAAGHWLLAAGETRCPSTSLRVVRVALRLRSGWYGLPFDFAQGGTGCPSTSLRVDWVFEDEDE